MSYWLLFLSIRPVELIGAVLVCLLIGLGAALVWVLATSTRFPGRPLELTDIDRVRR